jgi:Tol biopolymer transport system component
VIAPSAAWEGDSVFYTAAGRQGVQIWRQRLSPQTFDAIGAPDVMIPGGDYAFFPSASRGRLSFVATHADVNLWSLAIDAATGKAHGPLRRLTRGAGIVSHLTVSQDGGTLAYFAVDMTGSQLHVRNLENGSDAMIAGEPGINRGFPALSPNGQRLAYSALLSAATRKVSNPRISRDGRWLAFDAMQPGGSPEVAIAPLAQTATVQEADWIVVSESASHPFWSRDGRLLYYLTTFPNADIRSRVLARSFDPSTGRVTSAATEVITLREMIVPAMVTGTAPSVAPDQIIFVLGDFRGDIWIRDV